MEPPASRPPEQPPPSLPSPSSPIAPAGRLIAAVLDRPASLAVAGGLLVAVVAVAPGIAILLAWPLLFAVPGWILVGRFVPDLTIAGRLGVSVVTSVYLSAHVTNALARLAGTYDRTVALGALALLVAGSAAAAWRWWRVPYDDRLEPARLPETPRGALIVAGLATAWVGLVLGLSIWHLTPSGWVSGGWNWSDLLVHVSIAESLNAGNFPPQVPYFAGVPLTYHWFADFHAALAAILAGTGTIPVMAFTAALMAGALALLVWELAWRLLGDRRAALIATVIAVFGGGMGYLRLPCDLAGVAQGADCDLPASLAALPSHLLGGDPDLFGLVSAHSYDNIWLTGWPFFKIASVMGTGLLTHRATALGLPGLVAVVLLVAVSLGRRPGGVWLAGLLAALLAPFHFFAFPAVYLIVLLQVVAARAWRTPGWALDAVRFLAPAVLAIPFVLPAFAQVSEAERLRVAIGWEEAPIRDGFWAVGFFYVTNLGVPFLLAIAAAFAPRLPHRAFLVAWAAALFAIPNLFVFTAVVFDMNKYFQIMWIAVALMAAWLVRDRSRRALAALAVPTVLAPVLVSLWFVGSSWVVLSVPDERAAGWIREHTPEQAVFVTEPSINSPVDLAGRLRLTTFGPYVANLGYDPGPRSDDVRRIRCEGPETAAELMRQYGATYVFENGRPDCDGAPPTDFDSGAAFEAVYADGNQRIWRLRD